MEMLPTLFDIFQRRWLAKLNRELMNVMQVFFKIQWTDEISH
ncbi:hypothetical protein ACG9WQ_013960 [Acinetobacter variabilis]